MENSLDGNLFSLDIETDGLSPFINKLLCIGLYSEQTGYLYFGDLETFARWHKPNNRYIAHSGRFDFNFLRRLGLDICDSFCYDTRNLAHSLIPLPTLAEGQKHVYGLENLYMQLLGGSAYKVDRTNMANLSEGELRSYNERDCRVTWDLFNYLVDKLPSKTWQFIEEWVMPGTRYCANMEYQGVWVDKPGLTLYSKCVTTQRDEILKKLNELTEEPRRIYYDKQVKELDQIYQDMALKAFVKAKDKEKSRKRYQDLFQKAKEKIEPFNWNSPLQLQWLLGEHYGLDLFNKRTKKTSTDEGMLRTHVHSSEVCRVLCQYREYEKMVSTCIPALVDNLQPDNRIHSFFNLTGTRTGRLSCSSPNLQQVPKGPIRSFIKAEKGYKLFVGDYAQIEPRIMAHLAGEQELINAFKEEKDIYAIIARNLLQVDCDIRELKDKFPKERGVAKTAGLSILYGTGATKLQEVLKKDLNLNYSLKECKTFIESYRNSFPKIKAFKSQLEVDLANQKIVYNLLGRPIYIENNDDLYMQALNTMVQGSSSDLVVRAAMDITKAFPFIKPVMLIHDEMVFEIAEDKINPTLIAQIEKIVTKDIEQLLQLTIPLKLEYSISKEWSKP